MPGSGRGRAKQVRDTAPKRDLPAQPWRTRRGRLPEPLRHPAPCVGREQSGHGTHLQIFALEVVDLTLRPLELLLERCLLLLQLGDVHGSPVNPPA